MSADFYLELSNTMSINLIQSIFDEFESTKITNELKEKGRLTAYFSKSNAQIVTLTVKDREIYAEQYQHAKWKVGVLAAINDRGVDDHSDIVKFIEKIIDRSSSAFILTYQYETTYAVRAEDEPFFTVNEQTPKWLQSSEKAIMN